MNLPADEDRGARHALLSLDGPTVPIQRTEGERIADARGAIRDARDTLVTAYRQSVAGRLSGPQVNDALHVALDRITAAQAALDGPAPRRRLNPRRGPSPAWTTCTA